MERVLAGASRRYPLHGWLGLGLVAVAWSLSWGLQGLRTHLLFFPLWLGYVLAVDGLLWRRGGSSPWSRSRRGFARLFVVSIPGWWLFEAFNERVGNWHYLGGEHFSDVEYVLLASLSFSTVVPAVFVTAELLRTAPWTERLAAGPRFGFLARRGPCAAAGVAMLALLLAWPRVFYPLLWIGVLCVLDPLAARLGRPSLGERLARGDWRQAAALALGALVCGFFWELWNAHSYPKWIYETPGVEFAHLFEMPLLGYLGYLPFGLELHALAHLLGPRLSEPYGKMPRSV